MMQVEGYPSFFTNCSPKDKSNRVNKTEYPLLLHLVNLANHHDRTICDNDWLNTNRPFLAIQSCQTDYRR